MIRLNVFVEVSEQNRPQFVALTKELVELSLAESGCVAYDLFQSETRPCVLMICETWLDEQALESHNQTEHYKRLVPQMAELAQIKLEKLEM